MIKRIVITIFLLTLVGGILRFYNLANNPVSLSVDEVSFGYNAYSILKTARDENGQLLPLTFKSVGDYKNPVPIYSMVPFIAIFGLNEFAIRFPTALVATLSIPIFFLFCLELSRKKSISLIATILLTFSPWHIYYSRYVSDQLMAATFVFLGLYAFLKIQSGRIRWSIISGFFFILSMYTYYPERLFVPLFSLVLLILNCQQVRNNLKPYLYFVLTEIVLVLPLAYLTFFGPIASRANMVFITKDIEFNRNVVLYDYKGFIQPTSLLASKYLLLPFFWARKFLNYIQPSFLFYSGLNTTRPQTYGLGVLYFFEIATFLSGLIYVLKNKLGYKSILYFWLILGLLPASLTNNEQNPGRTLIIFPVLIIISALGIGVIRNWYKSIANMSLRTLLLVTFIAVIGWDLVHALLIYSLIFPVQRGEDFMEGTKDAVLYALENQNKYKEIIFDPYRGVTAPYIVSIPHEYILFYAQYDPHKYQTETKVFGNEYFKFNKFVVKPINWPEDGIKKGTLFIGTPWSIPEKDLNKDKILKKIYLSSGNLAFIIAETEK